MPTGRNGRPIIANVDRLHRLMDAAGLAAVVVRGGQNVTYLSGVSFHGTLSRHLDLAASRRGVVVIWPRHAQPIFVLEVTAAGAAARDSWIEKFEVFNGYTEPLFDRVSKRSFGSRSRRDRRSASTRTSSARASGRTSPGACPP